MKNLKEALLNEALLNRPKNVDVAQMLADAAEEYIKTNYIIKGKLTFENVNGTCVVNCDGSATVKNEEIGKLTEGFVWGEVDGNFDCTYCDKLKTLEGAPKNVEGYFDCSYCYSLETLEGASEYVGGEFDCSYCKKLTSLKGAPKVVGDFNCSDCKNLTSLEGSPEYVGGDFICSHNQNLISLKGSPETIDGFFDCRHCKNLKSLEGAPKNSKIDCDDRLK